MQIDLETIENDKYKVNISHFRRDEPKGIVVVFPGAGYSHMGPCLYYSSGALYEQGYEVFNFEYDFRRERLESNLESTYKMYFDFLMNGLEKFNLPDRKIILSKSIGTRIVASGNIERFDKIIWLTPALKDDFVYQKMANLANKSLSVIGDCDPFFDQEKINELDSRGMNSLVISGADHGLDIDTDLNRSLDELKNVISRVEEFVLK